MFFSLRWSFKNIYLLAFGLTIVTVSPVLLSEPSVAQLKNRNSESILSQSQFSSTVFSDVPASFWASPFIRALVQRQIITGFPDGTFKPERPVERAEFAAMLEKAFNQNPVRQLSTQGFSDVPADYWAASAIKEAYETGFMLGYPGNVFQPNQEIPKVQAIVALSNGLRLTAAKPVTETLNTYYTDVFAIPTYAQSSVAAATEASMVVNYPDAKTLNPTENLTRAEAAALIYQALVNQGQAQPLAANLPAASYIVAGTPGPTQAKNDIVSIASSSDSFSTLTSLLQSANLADILQQPGPYTVFAPTDAAFAALPPETLQELQQPENKELLVKILRYHVVPGRLSADQISAGELQTLEGQPVNIQVDSSKNQIAVNATNVIQADIDASNGVIHAVNQVLIPPDFDGTQKSETETKTETADSNGADLEPGRATRGGSSYIGVGGNIGLGGETALGEGSFAAISKIGLTRRFSARPSVIIDDDPVILLPLTFDFSPRTTPSVAGRSFNVSPYLGAGVAIETSDDADVGFLLTGGIDVPLGDRFTVNGSANAAFLDDDTDVGLLLGIGYNF
ncbi:fasciclin domain-containing protein [Mastigocoleus testarum]|uniref:Beta-Ig-H3/fasciclin n=1 Tax=Mastigocoleus testarum BC008 TaxID=371196 RepID=A0A0V7ZGX0_9CYAN|nr:fasciclin domain-containing protein [Mastigocoleus testarum]KST63698.1 beta-Ig-H3/fasciclin [Mastigocoleus testarum BC008]KST63760.1 beta-Ig-H3/fasciclin [Mastigocoleus testarum BC008]